MIAGIEIKKGSNGKRFIRIRMRSHNSYDIYIKDRRLRISQGRWY